MRRRAFQRPSGAALSLLAACAAGAAGAACATGATLDLDRQTMTTRLEAARQGGAYRCAPRELAEAETHLEFLEVELDEGNAVRAAEHRDQAREALTQVIEKVKGCKPIAPPDRDGDGVADDQDACPDTPGPVKFLGCPDRDNDGIPDNVDKCPDVPENVDGFEDEDGCPDASDRDKDGIADTTDQCPDEPEDKDNYKDEDGCPDPDNDGDGILDVNDKCPDQPETRNNYQDEDGCPDVNPSLVVVNRDLGKIEIKQKVFFDTAKWTIKSVSFRLLNEVAEVLKSNPSMEVLVEGHTDSQGSDASNMKLSQNRAASVREYLIGQGVDAQRLTSIGFGETKPIDENKTAAGRERNRRVEFTIVKD
ncbi:MAG: OmpA family protein [Deltaproteobacteria bacterium]|nr:OmpA family protein [Deltaproteobacteria bacterium]